MGGSEKGEVFTSSSSGFFELPQTLPPLPHSVFTTAPGHLHLHVCVPADCRAPGSHGPVYGGFPLSQECNVTLISKAHTLTSYLNTVRLWTHLFLDNLERPAVSQSWHRAKICILVSVGFPLKLSPVFLPNKVNYVNNTATAIEWAQRMFE